MSNPLDTEIETLLEGNPLAREYYFKALKAYFVQTQEELWLRVDFVTITNMELNAHDENSGEEYQLDLLTEQGLRFYGVEELT